jgi:hypothetical protein
MNPLVNIGIFLVIAGVVVVGAVMLSASLASRRRQQSMGGDEPVIPVNLASVNDAVLVAGLGGQITFANEVAREWLSVDTNSPDLWQIAQRVIPPESFLELFAAEGQATFAAGGRSIEATSHRIAMGDGNGHGGAQFIVVMRPCPALTVMSAALPAPCRSWARSRRTSMPACTCLWCWMPRSKG